MHSPDLTSCETGPLLMEKTRVQRCCHSWCNPASSRMLQKKGHSFVPHMPRLGAADAAKKRAAFRSPTAPLGGGLRGARLRRRPIPWTPPRCLTDRRELHRWLAVTDNPPIKPCISRAPPPLAGPLHRNQSLPPQARFLDSDPGSACPTAKKTAHQTKPGETRDTLGAEKRT